ncbi:MAG: spore coat U domain-containing protein [Neisseriaceae bacterium]|nr:spore coat U domain-containing protein [Neisseriaceae bacterium]
MKEESKSMSINHINSNRVILSLRPYAESAKYLSFIFILSLLLLISHYASASDDLNVSDSTNSLVSCMASMNDIEFDSVDFVTNSSEEMATGTLSYTCNNTSSNTKAINICFYITNNSSSAVPNGWYPLTNNTSVLAVQLRGLNNEPIPRVINEIVTLSKKSIRTWNIPIRAILNTGQVQPTTGVHSLTFSSAQTGISFLTGTGATIPATCGRSIKPNAFRFDIKANVISACLVSLVNDLDFGITSTISSVGFLDAQSNLAFRCTKNTPYRVSLLSKNMKNNQFNMVGMQMGSLTFIPYYIYKDPARSIAWNSQSPLSSIGTGYNQSYTVYGRVYIPSFQVPANDYLDTNMIQIIY